MEGGGGCTGKGIWLKRVRGKMGEKLNNGGIE